MSSSEVHAVVEALRGLQTCLNAIPAGAAKTNAQAAFDTLIRRLASADKFGPLRVGLELPAAE